MTDDDARVWTVTITAPCEWLTSNDRRSRWAEARLIALWRSAAATYARSARLPTGLARVRIDAEARFAGHRRVRDAANLGPTLKAVVDGLGPARTIRRRDPCGPGSRAVIRAPGYGLIPDDDDKHLDGPYPTIGPLLPARPLGPAGVLIVTITEVA